jgi:hypothetical protein
MRTRPSASNVAVWNCLGTVIGEAVGEKVSVFSSYTSAVSRDKAPPARRTRLSASNVAVWPCLGVVILEAVGEKVPVFGSYISAVSRCFWVLSLAEKLTSPVRRTRLSASNVAVWPSLDVVILEEVVEKISVFGSYTSAVP